jgi:hypothetical protein
VFKRGSRTRVIGEVFALNHAERLLSHLDHYEGTAEPSNPFRRVKVDVLLGDYIHHRRIRDQRPSRF